MKEMQREEKNLHAKSGMGLLVVNTLIIIAAIVGFVFSALALETGEQMVLSVIGLVVTSLLGFIICPVLYAGLKVLKPNEALVLTLFGKYHGTLTGPGFFFVNPFCVPASPVISQEQGATTVVETQVPGKTASTQTRTRMVPSKKISLKAMTLNNDLQKINDAMGNPIIIGIVVIWKVVNTAKAVFNVDNYKDYLSIQTDAALRNIVRLYPYDVASDEDEKSLRGSSLEIAEKLKKEIQGKVDVAGLEITEARITSLYYAPEIASAMLQRQQANAIIDARQMIVEGAVGMVEMALDKLSENNVVVLDEERKAAMVSNLLVVLCGNRDAQPIVNSGSIY